MYSSLLGGEKCLRTWNRHFSLVPSKCSLLPGRVRWPKTLIPQKQSGRSAQSNYWLHLLHIWVSNGRVGPLAIGDVGKKKSELHSISHHSWNAGLTIKCNIFPLCKWNCSLSFLPAEPSVSWVVLEY